MSRSPVVRVLGLASCLLFTGCGGSDEPNEAGPHTAAVKCEPSSVVVGETVQCTVTTRDLTGRPLQDAPRYTWSILGSGDLATVDQEGKVTTWSAGTVRVGALSMGPGQIVDGQATLRITDIKRLLTAVKTTCESTPRMVGKTVQCTASATDQQNRLFTVTGYTWTSSNEAVATVDANGRVSIHARGVTEVTASATDGDITRRGSFPLTVTAPTEHRDPVTANETWSLADSPHIVTKTVVVGGPLDPILTLEAGVEVLFESGTALMIGADARNPGTLRVNTSAQTPTRFSARSDAPQPGHWAGVYFVQTSPAKVSRLNTTVIEYAGDALAGMPSTPGVRQFTGALNVLANPDAPERGTRVFFNNVEVRKSKEHGVVLGTRLSASSLLLSSHDNGKAGLVAAANAVGSIPSGSQLKSNGIQEVLVWGGAVTESQTWPRLDVPYQLVSLVESRPASISVGSTAYPTLGLEAGLRMFMPAGSSLLVGMSEPGSLWAGGTENAPVQFMADTALPTPGFWSGLHFGEARNSTLSYVQVSHAGAKLNGTLGGGAVNLYQPLDGLIHDSTLRDSSGCGIAVAPSVTTDFTRPEYGNVFINLAGANQCVQQ